MLKRDLQKIMKLAQKNKKLSADAQNAELIDKADRRKNRLEIESTESERFFNEMKRRDF